MKVQNLPYPFLRGQPLKFSSATKALYTVVLLLIQQMQKDLTCTGAEGISITFRVSQFQEIACDIHSHLAREASDLLPNVFHN